MKHVAAVVTALALSVSPTLVSGQSSPAAGPGAKAAAAKPRLARTAIKAVEERTPVDDDPSIVLSEAELDIARRVHTGVIPCELGASVSVIASRREGFFVVQTGKHRFRMHPVESRTGAIRLEDPHRGALWLQLGNKSMLMSQKLGMRLADECKTSQQAAVAEELLRNPVPSILDAPPPAAAPAAASPASAAR